MMRVNSEDKKMIQILLWVRARPIVPAPMNQNDPKQ